MPKAKHQVVNTILRLSLLPFCLSSRSCLLRSLTDKGTKNLCSDSAYTAVLSNSYKDSLACTQEFDT